MKPPAMIFSCHAPGSIQQCLPNPSRFTEAPSMSAGARSYDRQLFWPEQQTAEVEPITHPTRLTLLTCGTSIRPGSCSVGVCSLPPSARFCLLPGGSTAEPLASAGSPGGAAGSRTTGVISTTSLTMRGCCTLHDMMPNSHTGCTASSEAGGALRK